MARIQDLGFRSIKCYNPFWRVISKFLIKIKMPIDIYLIFRNCKQKFTEFYG